MTTYWCQWAWLGGEQVAAAVVIQVEGDRITAVTPDMAVPPGATRLLGVTLPGLVNAHSHAFHRALRARTHGGEGSFWTWREQMYDLARRLDPESYHRLARATFAEMAEAGITIVGEFHYLHHQRDGGPYDDPNAMGEALLAAAAEVGIRITLLDTCYLHGGIGRDLDDVQQRFSDVTPQRWVDRVSGLRTGPMAVVGAAIHSARALLPAEMTEVVAFAAQRSLPLHAHVSEQPAENEACIAEYGLTPSALLAEVGALGPSFTAVHATHLTAADIDLLGRSHVCLCPTTERDLADGIGPASALARAGANLSLGSDSQAVIDLFEEARAVELDERLATGQRGHHRPHELLRAATNSDALGWPAAGRLAAGALADLVTVRPDSTRLAGTAERDLVAALVFAATAADVDHVVVGGQVVVRDGHHVSIETIPEIEGAIQALETAPRASADHGFHPLVTE